MPRYQSLDLFDNYRSLRARFNSTGNCGHEITQGELIGWNPRIKRTVCADCWIRWCEENAEAASWESQYSY